MLVAIHVLQAVAQRTARGESQQLFPHSWHRHARAAAHALRIPVPQQEHYCRLLALKVVAGLAEVGQHVAEESCTREAQKSDVSQLVVHQKVCANVLPRLVVLPDFWIDGEVHEVFVVLKPHVGGHRVRCVVLHLPDPEVVRHVSAARRAAHPVVVIPVDNKQEAAFHIRRELIENGLGQLPGLIVEVVPQNGKHVHARVSIDSVEHGDGARECLELVGISAVDPLGRETRV
mmetsp:Transcript_119553/g.283910  ORF Transcript_119553/g.283910 Transcript_119553/m.283910 type:complete len:232 (-) Transcript_119553:427-1122(-)